MRARRKESPSPYLRIRQLKEPRGFRSLTRANTKQQRSSEAQGSPVFTGFKESHPRSGVEKAEYEGYVSMVLNTIHKDGQRAVRG